MLAEEIRCALCGRPVDTTLPAGTPASPEVDEDIPVSRGGDPLARDNVTLMHRACNQWKSDRTLVEARSALVNRTHVTPAPAPVQHSGTW